MRWSLIAGAALTFGVAGSLQAEDGPYRRFTQPSIDTNRNNLMVYAPVASAHSGPRPADMPHSVAAAIWYAQGMGSQGTAADRVLDGAKYTLDRFASVSMDGTPLIEVIITRFPAPAADWDTPLLRVVDAATSISAAATPISNPVPGGVRYRFTVRPPLQGFEPMGESPKAPRYLVEFLPYAGVRKAAELRRAATFDGASVDLKMQQGPPQLPATERVAGKRLEFRNARTAGRVVFDQKVAGKRQEIRGR